MSYIDCEQVTIDLNSSQVFRSVADFSEKKTGT